MKLVILSVPVTRKKKKEGKRKTAYLDWNKRSVLHLQCSVGQQTEVLEPLDHDLLHRWFVQTWNGTENLRGDTYTLGMTKVEITWGRCLGQKYEGEGAEGMVKKMWVCGAQQAQFMGDKQHHVWTKCINALGIDCSKIRRVSRIKPARIILSDTMLFSSLPA